MVYEIRPHATHVNGMIDLEYQQDPDARSWMEYTRKKQPVEQKSAPVLIQSERPTPLPDAFEISRDYWCVSARVKQLMERLFDSQVAFYEVPVTAKPGDVPLPSTYFVAFSQFFELIDWQKSKVKVRTRSGLPPEIEVIDLADTPAAAVFKAIPGSQPLIWIEPALRKGNRLFSPGDSVYATDAAAETIGEAFPEVFILRKQRATIIPRSGIDAGGLMPRDS
jgi:hypothetical protein